MRHLLPNPNEPLPTPITPNSNLNLHQVWNHLSPVHTLTRYDIFFSDSDAAWLADPRPFIRTLTAPFVVQLNFPQEQVNSGVFYMRATPATQHFLQLVNELGSTEASRRAVRAR